MHSDYLEQKEKHGDDALALFEYNDELWFCIADGAGGTAGASDASKVIVSMFRNAAQSGTLRSPDEFEAFLRHCDSTIMGRPNSGESTAVIGKVANGEVIGASCGDSEAWLYNETYSYELTNLQCLKPLLGSGEACPIGFGPMEKSHLVIGSDGLFKYTNRHKIKELALQGNMKADDIATLAKVTTGKLQDDISVILINN